MTSDLGDKNITFPFGAYDIFSYIIPGSTALLCIYFFDLWCHSHLRSPVYTPIHAIFYLKSADAMKDNFALSALYLLSLICIVYVLGHIVSSLSSFALDRIYTAKGHGYPFETLLLLPKEGGGRKDDSKGFYQGSFFWLNAYLVLRFLSFFYKDNVSIWRTMNFIEILLCFAIILKIVVGIYRSNRKGLTDAEEVLERGPLSKPTHFYADRLFPALKKAANFFFTKLYPLGYNLVSRSIQNHLRTARPFSKKFLHLYRMYFRERFDIDPEEAGSNNFWLCRLFITDQSPIFDRYLNYWLHMYSYARNLSTSFYLAFLYGFWWVFIHSSLKDFQDPAVRKTMILMPLLYLFLSMVLLMRFRYIYLGYYNRFLYRGFVYLNEPRREGAVVPTQPVILPPET